MTAPTQQLIAVSAHDLAVASGTPPHTRGQRGAWQTDLSIALEQEEPDPKLIETVPSFTLHLEATSNIGKEKGLALAVQHRQLEVPPSSPLLAQKLPTFGVGGQASVWSVAEKSPGEPHPPSKAAPAAAEDAPELPGGEALCRFLKILVLAIAAKKLQRRQGGEQRMLPSWFLQQDFGTLLVAARCLRNCRSYSEDSTSRAEFEGKAPAYFVEYSLGLLCYFSEVLDLDVSRREAKGTSSPSQQDCCLFSTWVCCVCYRADRGPVSAPKHCMRLAWPLGTKMAEQNCTVGQRFTAVWITLQAPEVDLLSCDAHAEPALKPE
ncbi:hypothetical protein Anapl_18996 [Anas platyrhynchos]|uniref:Uncharacterized protein n=1 Tax=Anas platyrhynchos TaxID=8839 RepID=R0L466_ANAPL|nr:hypothetical protein Anapl_18996 [Anas platyrhynchos]